MNEFSPKGHKLTPQQVYAKLMSKRLKDFQKYYIFLELLTDEFNEQFSEEELVEVANRFLKLSQGKLKPKEEILTRNYSTSYSLDVYISLKKETFHNYWLQQTDLTHTNWVDYSICTKNRSRDIINGISEQHFIVEILTNVRA